jgi:hypothetical protein
MSESDRVRGKEVGMVSNLMEAGGRIFQQPDHCGILITQPSFRTQKKRRTTSAGLSCPERVTAWDVRTTS